MGSIYDRADIYDLLEDEERFHIYKKHWEKILEKKNIKTLLDVSIGSGSVTLPLAELGIQLAGSDLSRQMLHNCRKKAESRGYKVDLKCADFRNVSSVFDKKFDCVASTGNSLPYVNNEEVLKTLEQMDAMIKPDGYLYFDIRNWDKILKERNRFYLYNPFFDGDTRINLMQVWDYHEDDSMTFHLLYTFERNNQIFQKEKFEEHYIPISRKILLDKLSRMGYQEIEIQNFPACQKINNVNEADWYCVTAKKA